MLAVPLLPKRTARVTAATPGVASLALVVGALAQLCERPARADVALPPTGVIDFLYFGIPLGLLAGAALVTGAVLLFRLLRRRGRGRLFACAMAALLFVGGNLVCYFSYFTFIRPAQRAARWQRQQEQDRLGAQDRPDAGAWDAEPWR